MEIKILKEGKLASCLSSQVSGPLPAYCNLISLKRIRLLQLGQIQYIVLNDWNASKNSLI